MPKSRTENKKRFSFLWVNGGSHQKKQVQKQAETTKTPRILQKSFQAETPYFQRVQGKMRTKLKNFEKKVLTRASTTC